MNFKLSAFADEASNKFSEQVETLKERNIPYLEIRSLDGKNVGDISIEEAKEVRRVLEAEGKSVWSIGSRLGKIGADKDFAPHLDDFKRTLELTEVLGCSKIRMFSFYMPNSEGVVTYRDTVMERLERFLDAAKGSGIKLCHENEKGIYGDDIQRSLDIAKTFSEIGLVFDPANFVQCGVDTLEAWSVLKDYVTYVHIKDALYDGSVVPAGKGEGHLPEILKDYSRMGGGVLTLEPHLSVFDGLKALEREGEETKISFSYPDNKTAFIAAHDALCDIINNI